MLAQKDSLKKKSKLVKRIKNKRDDKRVNMISATTYLRSNDQDNFTLIAKNRPDLVTQRTDCRLVDEKHQKIAI
jgi:hypothetical protein